MDLLSFLALLSILITFRSLAYGRNDFLIDDERFSDVIKVADTQLVMFFAPWCGHCKQLMPVFEEAHKKLWENNPQIPLFIVDCAGSGKKTCDHYNVTGYPTLKIFQRGNHFDYNGPRSLEGMIKYMKFKGGPGYEDLNNVKKFKRYIKGPSVAVVGFFHTWCEYNKHFVIIADELRESYRFGLVSTSRKVFEVNGLKDNTIILYRPKHLHSKYEPKFVTCNVQSIKGIKDWMQKHKYSVVDQRTLANMQDFKAPLIVIYYRIDWENNKKETIFWRNSVLEVAHHYSDTFNFAISDIIEFKKELEGFGYEEEKGPVIFAVKDKILYGYTNEFSSFQLKTFVLKLAAGELKPYVKSEPIPENNGRVKKAVANNFDALVTKSEKDIFLGLHEKNCIPCRKMEIMLNKLAELLPEDENIEIVKMDANKNEIPLEFSTKNMPGIYWIPKGSHKIKYDGEINSESFLKFVASHATMELKHFYRNGDLKDKLEL